MPLAEGGFFGSRGRRKSTNEASDSVVRKIWVLLQLLREERVSFESYTAQYRRDFRSFQRDLQQLRAIGEQAGFSITNIKEGSYAELVHFDSKIRRLRR